MNSLRGFSDAAGKLSRNPLGIIALFIVLVYGMASLVTALIGSSGSSELYYLVYFLIFFPVLVLAAFLWLVSQHSDKLYGPGDFANEDNFMALRIAASLGVASAKLENEAAYDIERIVNSARLVAPSQSKQPSNWKNKILWVDDRPQNNTYERQAFETIGLEITTALSTQEAFDLRDPHPPRDPTSLRLIAHRGRNPPFLPGDNRLAFQDRVPRLLTGRKKRIAVNMHNGPGQMLNREWRLHLSISA